MNVPTQTETLKLGPVSQVNIQAMPLNAEAYDYPVLMITECQFIANHYKLPVVFTDKQSERYTFFPQND